MLFVSHDEYLTIMERCLKIATSLRNYNTNYNEFQNGAVLPYNAVKKRHMRIYWLRIFFLLKTMLEKQSRWQYQLWKPKRYPSSYLVENYIRFLKERLYNGLIMSGIEK